MFFLLWKIGIRMLDNTFKTIGVSDLADVSQLVSDLLAFSSIL